MGMFDVLKVDGQEICIFVNNDKILIEKNTLLKALGFANTSEAFNRYCKDLKDFCEEKGKVIYLKEEGLKQLELTLKVSKGVYSRDEKLAALNRVFAALEIRAQATTAPMDEVSNINDSLMFSLQSMLGDLETLKKQIDLGIVRLTNEIISISKLITSNKEAEDTDV